MITQLYISIFDRDLNYGAEYRILLPSYINKLRRGPEGSGTTPQDEVRVLSNVDSVLEALCAIYFSAFSRARARKLSRFSTGP